MKKCTRPGSSRTLLNWVLGRGRQLLTCQVERTGNQYRVSARSQEDQGPLYARCFEQSGAAFHSHAALVSDLRGLGWTTVAYQ